jgi:hypothetical protein
MERWSQPGNPRFAPDKLAARLSVSTPQNQIRPLKQRSSRWAPAPLYARYRALFSVVLRTVGYPAYAGGFAAFVLFMYFKIHILI